MKRFCSLVAISSLLAVLFACGRTSHQAAVPATAVEGNAAPPALPSSSSDGHVYEVGANVSAPVLVYEAKPVFPEQYRHAHITQPLYIFDVVVAESGRVSSVVLSRGPAAVEPYVSFERAFREAIANNRYTPATRAGKPVAVRIVVTATIEVG